MLPQAYLAGVVAVAFAHPVVPAWRWLAHPPGAEPGMTTLPSAAGPPRPPTRRAGRQFIPPQHGAWAMLVVPWLAGVLTAGFRWVHLPLLGGWLAAYPLSYYALQAVKTRRTRRFRAQMLAYGPPALLLGGVVLALRPQVLWFAPAYTALLAINVAYAWRRRERALVNDLASVAQCCLMVLVVATVAAVGLREVVAAFVAVLLYFTGTVLYVKTMIREQGNATYRRVSAAYHVLALAMAAWLSAALAAVFALLLVRAVALPGRGLAPKRVGVIEIVLSVLLLAAAVAA